jgi:pimeloyl-ACP methyl ester carboxylesterase
VTIKKRRSRFVGRKAGRTVTTVVLILTGCAAFSLSILLLWSPGTVQQIQDENGEVRSGSISEKTFVSINGLSQGMFIEGTSTDNPVLLYLHGGMPDYFLSRTHPVGLEEAFTVCWWEQRGSGLSYREDIPAETMTEEQLIADAIAVTDYLRNRFGQDRIYLMGHSGGTFLGMQLAAHAPERYHAYIGVAQMSDQLASEMLAHEYMVEAFHRRGDHAMVRRLQAAPVTAEKGTPAAYLAVRDRGMHTLGVGTTRDARSVVRDVFFASLQCRQYTLGEKLTTWIGKARSGVSFLWPTMLATDLQERVSAVDIPIYFLHGAYDYTCSYPEARRYFDTLRAPIKGFYTFSESAHSPIFEEPARAMRILREDVLQGENLLADARQE